jgi:hypothetical protein
MGNNRRVADGKGSTPPPRDAWEVHPWTDDDDVDSRPWRELLADPRACKGLSRITLDVFAGRAGQKTLATFKCSTSGGDPIRDATTVAELDVEDIVTNLVRLARQDHERTGRKRYGCQLWQYTAKSKNLEQGEMRAVTFGGAGDVDDEPSALKLLGYGMKQLEQAYRHNERLLDITTALAMGHGNARLVAMDHMHDALQLTRAASVKMQQMASTPSPEEGTKRLLAVLNTVRGPMQTVAEHTGPALGNLINSWAGAAGAAGPGSGPPSEAQAKAQAFVKTLTPEQSDKLAEIFTPDGFRQIMEVIHGPTDQWAANYPTLVRILESKQLDLLRVLTQDQIAMLMAMKNAGGAS